MVDSFLPVPVSMYLVGIVMAANHVVRIDFSRTFRTGIRIIQFIPFVILFQLSCNKLQIFPFRNTAV